MTKPATTLKPAPHPERWQFDGADAATATLVIPADAFRERQFEIACAMTVALTPGVEAPWMQMTVQANGAQQWQRRMPAHAGGEWDGLDFRFSRRVPVGQALRIAVAVAGAGVRRRSLLIEADEIQS